MTVDVVVIHWLSSRSLKSYSDPVSHSNKQHTSSRKKGHFFFRFLLGVRSYPQSLAQQSPLRAPVPKPINDKGKGKGLPAQAGHDLPWDLDF